VSFLLGVLLAVAQDVRVDATVSAERIGVEDVLELTVSVTGGEAEGEPELPELPGFRVAGRSTSSQIQIVNGRMSSTRAFIYQLLPQKEGSFEIPAIAVQAGGTTHRTDPVTVEVVPGSVVSRRPRGFGMDPFDRLDPFARRREPEIEKDAAFVRVEVSSRSVVQGEQLVVTYRIYSRYAPLGPEITDDPPMSGFWVEEVNLGREPPVDRRTIDGKQYITFPIKQRVLFPTKSGTLEIPPVTFSMAFRVSSSDPFDAFFARASTPIPLRSQAVSIDVAPLPAEGRGPDFKGAVGQYRFDAVLNQEDVEAGDPVTLTLTLGGKGNFRSVAAPEIPKLSGFRAFAPKVDETFRASSEGFEGEKKWEYVLVPESGGVKELGPWRFQYFDPVEKKYVTASAGPLELSVRGGAATGAATATGSARREVTLLREDIRFLKEAPERLGIRESAFYRSPLFYASLILPVLWNVGFVVFRKRQEKEKTHSHLFRRRRANRMARSRLKRAGKLAEAESKDFYEEVASALYRYVGDKSSQSPSGLTASIIDATLEERAVPEELRREFADVLGKCEEARFTPGARTRDDMEALRQRTEELIVAIERHWRERTE
jgi:hypothetical protein